MQNATSMLFLSSLPIIIPLSWHVIGIDAFWDHSMIDMDLVSYIQTHKL